MNWDPNVILYACIAKGTTILAEFNSKDADLGELAAKCLEKTPPFHKTFNQTLRGRTYMFLIEDPFVYFGIFDDKLENTACLSFLNGAKDSFSKIIDSNPARRLETLNSHCFQGEFSPVFHQLVASNSDFEIPSSPTVAIKDDSGSPGCSIRGKMAGSIALLADATKNLKKKKMRLFGRKKGRSWQENKVDVLSDDESSECPMTMQKNGLFGSDSGGNQKAKGLWKKQVWMVLSLDLIVCCILFAIWLWICRGFQCIA